MDLFNLSISTSTYPDDWKVAKVFPLFKSGERNDPNNFRPISVLPTIARVFERLVYKQMYTNLTENKLIQPCQSGFRSLHSTVPAFLVMTNQWCLTLIGGVASGVIFLDLKKAFDINDLKIWRLRTTEYGWTCAAHFWSTGSSTDHTVRKNEVKVIDYKVQTMVKAAVSTLLSLDSICLSKKLEIPLYVVWQIK